MNSKYIMVSLMILIIGTVAAAGGIAQDNNRYGGLALSTKDPPPGTTINEKLSIYYNRPVATGDDMVYWHVGGYGWFTQAEMLNLPSASLMYNISPYDCQSYGCGGGGARDSSGTDTTSTIPAPVSGFVLLGFIGVAAMIWRKHASN